MQKVWGTNHTVKIDIPLAIDDYNHWMLGCDLGDQLIASYRPTLRVRRYWMAMMFHGFDIIRINSYLAFKDLNEGKPLSQKEYLAKFIEALLLRAHEEESRHTRATTRSNSPTHERKTKRFRQSKKNPSLPSERFLPGEHKRIPAKTPDGKDIQRKCAYCAYLQALDRKHNREPREHSEPASICSTCQVHLCKDHFADYHNENIRL